MLFLTFKELQKENPNDTLLWIMGSDSYSKIDTWYNYEEFLEEVNLDCSHETRLSYSRKILLLENYSKEDRLISVEGI